MRNPVYRALVIAPAALIVFYLSMWSGFSLFDMAMGWTNPSNTPPTESLTPIPITDGGTGANSAASARADLGAAASGANSDITSLSPSGNLILSPTGGVGIGTSTASQELTVAGTIYTTGGIKFPDGTVQTTASTICSAALYTATTTSSTLSGCVYTTSATTNGFWTAKTSVPTAPLYSSSVAVNGIIYVIGGMTSGGTALSSTYAYNPSTNSWSTEANMPVALYNTAIGVVNGIVYIIGGYGSSGFSASTYAYNPSVNSWTLENSSGPNYQGMSAATANGIIYTFGGDSPKFSNLSSTYAYNPSTNSWSTEANMPTGGSFLSAGNINNVIYVTGGTSASAYAYNPSTNSWSTEANMPTNMSNPAYSVANNLLYVIGSSVYAYHPSTNSWTTETTLPVALYSSTATNVGSTVYDFGELSAGSTTGTTYVYTMPEVIYLYNKG